jgi:hypothetical protein
VLSCIISRCSVVLRVSSSWISRAMRSFSARTSAADAILGLEHSAGVPSCLPSCLLPV